MNRNTNQAPTMETEVGDATDITPTAVDGAIHLLYLTMDPTARHFDAELMAALEWQEF
jgi:hypothetical protein